MKRFTPLAIVIGLFFASACSAIFPAVEMPTPVDIPALQTSAVGTIIASYTQTAQVQATSTPPGTETPAPPAPSETPTVIPTGTEMVAPCDNLRFINDGLVIDGSIMKPGEEFEKTWKVVNAGTCTWSTGYQLIFDHGTDMDGKPAALTSDVLPNDNLEITINMKAPAKSGMYTGYWRFVNNSNLPFGPLLNVIIIVP